MDQVVCILQFRFMQFHICIIDLIFYVDISKNCYSYTYLLHCLLVIWYGSSVNLNFSSLLSFTNINVHQQFCDICVIAIWPCCVGGVTSNDGSGGCGTLSIRHYYLQVTLWLWTGASWGSAPPLPHHTVPFSCCTTTRVTSFLAITLWGTVQGVGYCIPHTVAVMI